MEMMKTIVCQQRYMLKQTYFDPFSLHLVTKTSPLKCMSNEQWNDLVDSWKNRGPLVMAQTDLDMARFPPVGHGSGTQYPISDMASPLLAEGGLPTQKELDPRAICISPFPYLNGRGQAGFHHMLAQSKLTLAPWMSMCLGP
jgi:hypothetical protein